MMTAIKAKEMRENAVQKVVAEKTAAAKVLCDTDINDAITTAANEMKDRTIITDIPRDLRAYIVAYLKDNGYYVEVLGETKINILWSKSLRKGLTTSTLCGIIKM